MIQVIKYILTISFTLLSIVLFADSVILSGMVLNSSNNHGIPNKAVTIKANLGMGQTYNSTAFTSNGGYFLDSVTVPTGQTFKFFVSVTDCNNITKTDSLIYPGSKTFQFLICDNSPLVCNAEFFAYQDTSNAKKINFNNLSTANTNKWNWVFGDGQSSNMRDPVHTYVNNGKYAVSLISYDTISNCFKHVYDTIFVGIPNPPCENSFTYGMNGLQLNLLGDVNTCVPAGYKWNFGDNSFATGKLVAHTYTSPGTYTITLKTIVLHPQTMTTCVTTTSKTIVVNSNPSAPIYGQILNSTSTNTDKGKVVLYKFDTSGNNYIEIGNTDIKTDTLYQVSYYYFASIPYGKYLTKAILDPSSVLFNSHAPTYCNSAVLWNQANPFTHNTTGLNHPINLSFLVPTMGTGSISGQVFENNKQLGDPVPNVLVILKNQYNEVVSFKHTNQNGEYSFTGLGLGSYTVFADVININAIPQAVTLTQNQSGVSEINIILNVIAEINEIPDKSSQFSIYPNPAKDRIYIQSKNYISDNCNLSIYSLTGQLMYEESISTNNKSLEAEIELTNFKEGLYLLMLVDSESRKYISKISIIK